MKNISSWFKQLGAKLSDGIQRFAYGRYGNDKLNMVILVAALILCIVTMFVNVWWLDFVLTVGSYVLLIWALFRSFSRNTYKRNQENRRFWTRVDRIKDRKNRYFDCPKCHQTVRVPRGKGKISITCPKCKEKFVKKT